MSRLFTQVISPCLPVLARMEARGIPLDVPMRDRLREEAEARLRELEGLIRMAVGVYHSKRRERVAQVLEDLERQRAAYDGSPRDERRKALTKRIQKARTRLEQIKEAFDIENDNHWRSYIYDEQVGLGLPVVHKTDSGLPSVDKEAIRALCIAHPQHATLRNRKETQDLAVRLRNRLAVEPDGRGRVHFAYSLHRTNTGRLASGADEDEADKARASEGGNGQNLTDRDRRMYVAEGGMSLVQFDWSQIEARVQAWLAKDVKMLQAWAEGLDVHAMAAAALFDCPVGEVREKKRYFEGQERSLREIAKRWRHGRNYGMGPNKASQMYGLTLAEAKRLEVADDKMWPAMAAFREKEAQQAGEEGKLTNPFGRTNHFPRKQSKGKWITADREQVLAFRPQSTVGDMCKVALPLLDQLVGTFLGAELLATVHDSFLVMVPSWQVGQFVKEGKKLLERPWKELGQIEGFGQFKCPVDVMVGGRWGKYDTLENPEGLREVA